LLTGAFQMVTAQKREVLLEQVENDPSYVKHTARLRESEKVSEFATAWNNRYSKTFRELEANMGRNVKSGVHLPSYRPPYPTALPQMAHSKLLSAMAANPSDILRLLLYVDLGLISRACDSDQIAELGEALDQILTEGAKIPIEYWYLIETGLVKPKDITKLGFQTTHGWHSPITLKVLIRDLGLEGGIEKAKVLENAQPHPDAEYPSDGDYRLKRIGAIDAKLSNENARLTAQSLASLLSSPLLKQGMTPDESRLLFGNNFSDSEQQLRTKSKLVRTFRGRSKEMNREIIKTR
jgi:hypothetical protein